VSTEVEQHFEARHLRDDQEVVRSRFRFRAAKYVKKKKEEAIDTSLRRHERTDRWTER